MSFRALNPRVAVRARLGGGAYHRVGSAGIGVVRVALVELPTLRSPVLAGMYRGPRR